MVSAREALRDADVLIAQHALKSAVNRLYYGAFYAARALLATRGLDSARHSGVIALFQQHFVKTGLVSVEVFRSFPRAFEKRLDVDYGDYATVTDDESRAIRTTVQAFVDECERILEQIITESPN